MDCPIARENLSALIDGELSLADRQAVERHLAGCAGCRAERDSLVAVSEAVRALPLKAAPPALARDIRDRLARESLIGLPAGAPARKKTLPFPVWLRGAGLAAAAVLLVVLVGDFGGGARRDLPDDEAPPAAPLTKKPAGTGQTDRKDKSLGSADTADMKEIELPEQGSAQDLALPEKLPRGAAEPEREAGGGAPGAGALESDKERLAYRSPDASGDARAPGRKSAAAPGAVTKALEQDGRKEAPVDALGESPDPDTRHLMEEARKVPPPVAETRAARAGAWQAMESGSPGAPETAEIRLVLGADGRRAEAITRLQAAGTLAKRKISLKKAEEAAGQLKKADKSGSLDQAQAEGKGEGAGEGEAVGSACIIEGEFTEEEIKALLADLARLGAVPRGDDLRLGTETTLRERGKDAGGAAGPHSPSPARRRYRLVLEPPPAGDRR